MKVNIKPYPLLHPTTIVIVGTLKDDRPNFTTIGDVAVAGLNPALIMISLHENHASTAYILKHKRMSINITNQSMIKEVDYAGIFSAKDKDKSDLFKSQIVDGLPIVEASPINLICEVIELVQVKQRMIFICNVSKTLVEDKYLNDNKLDLDNLDPILYGLDNYYYSGLKKIGKGYVEGYKIRNN